MTATATIYGHAVYWHDGDARFRYLDTDEPVDVSPPRPCPFCHQIPTPEGYDACLGYVPGALSVCCGHGSAPPSIAWTATVEVLRQRHAQVARDAIAAVIGAA